MNGADKAGLGWRCGCVGVGVGVSHGCIKGSCDQPIFLYLKLLIEFFYFFICVVCVWG